MKVLVNPQGHQSSQETNAQLLVVPGELFKRQINTPKQSIAAIKQLVFEEANKLTRRSVKFLQKTVEALGVHQAGLAAHRAREALKGRHDLGDGGVGHWFYR